MRGNTLNRLFSIMSRLFRIVQANNYLQIRQSHKTAYGLSGNLGWF